MCNSLHYDSKPIDKMGDGWKIFSKDFSRCGYTLHPLFQSASPYISNRDKSVSWKSKFHLQGQGFCFFKTKEEAERTLKILMTQRSEVNGSRLYRDCIVVKIRYYGGLGQHDELKMMMGQVFRTAICKRFRIHKDEKDQYLI